MAPRLQFTQARQTDSLDDLQHKDIAVDLEFMVGIGKPKRHDKILDIGTGAGLIIRYLGLLLEPLSESDEMVVLVDANDDNLRAAASLAEGDTTTEITFKWTRPNVTTRRINFATRGLLDFTRGLAPQGFDLVYATRVLHELDGDADKIAAIKLW